MKRKLFCEISPFTYKISRFKNCYIRNIQNIFNTKLANTYSDEKLKYVVYKHNSLIRRTLGNVDS